MASFGQLVVFTALFAAIWQQAFGMEGTRVPHDDDENNDGPDENETVVMMREMDTNGDKHVSLAEIKAELEENREHQEDPVLTHVYSTLEDVFAKTDENGDGLLSMTELGQLDAMMHESVEKFKAEEL
eukprot:TRINITY_DN1144_c0_g2_i1.p1 TRINITY_DN1144_c0_g2~~TRINITY_DN1144_c0_g2_i1.p1  ORF type:complete len:143 (-),score=40.54 TRINITY_DN1144_c0_g2_i1:55-438(-)